MVLGSVHSVGIIFCFLRSPHTMAFRVGGALESVQEQYFLSNLCFSMVTLDLQAQVRRCFERPELRQLTSLPVSPPAVFQLKLSRDRRWTVCSAFQVLKEAKVLVWVYMVQSLLQLALFVYLMYAVSPRHPWVKP
uniref:Uncharacterized protein n=1 Tax=Oryzias sinensis TaxID=183150 RepID=A0A8C8DSJ2_9TELE